MAFHLIAHLHIQIPFVCHSSQCVKWSMERTLNAYITLTQTCMYLICRDLLYFLGEFKVESRWNQGEIVYVRITCVFLRWDSVVFHCAWNKSDICVSFMIGLKLLFEWLNVFCYTDNPVVQFSSSFPSCVRFVWSVFGQNIVWQDARKLARFYKLDNDYPP